MSANQKSARRGRKKLTEEQKRQRALSGTVQRVFKRAGFAYLPTRGKYREIGGKDVEVDGVYLYENIILFCEDTVGKGSAHVTKTEESARIVSENFGEMLEWLREQFPDKFSLFASYSAARYQRRFIYFSESKKDVEPDRFPHLILCDPKTLRYFDLVTSALKKSARFEIFGYLGIAQDEVGFSDAGDLAANIAVNIICPEERMGLSEGVRAVSFMMAPGDLLECGYVLRKDSWEAPNCVYQRLVDPGRVAAIRRYIASNQCSFLNNIIVALPPDVVFKDSSGNKVDIENIQNYSRQYSIEIPKKYNSIRIIDGQHRIYAYHEGEDGLEQAVAQLRDKLHLLVTGLVFPPNMSNTARARCESQIFLDINKNTKRVSSDVILYIEELKDAFCAEGVARRILIALNEKRLFHRQFQLSSLDDAGIKTVSIIKFALKSLVAIENGNPYGLFEYWDGDKDALAPDRRSTVEAENALRDYVNYACKALCFVFGGVKKAFASEWDDPTSKIDSVTAINGFILAFKRTLPQFGVCDVNFYAERFGRLRLSFYRDGEGGEGFPYASSQYAMLAEQIVSECFPEVLEE